MGKPTLRSKFPCQKLADVFSTGKTHDHGISQLILPFIYAEHDIALIPRILFLCQVKNNSCNLFLIFKVNQALVLTQTSIWPVKLQAQITASSCAH